MESMQPWINDSYTAEAQRPNTNWDLESDPLILKTCLRSRQG